MRDLKKRELNKAQTKRSILQAMQTLIRQTNFRDLKAKDIAAHAKITEMTFYNYFKVKDDLLIYFMQVWTLDMIALQLQTPLQGEAAIRRIFDITASQIKDNPRIMLNLIAYQASLDTCPELVPLEAAECFLQYPHIKALHQPIHPDLQAIFLGHLQEIDPHADPHMHVTHLFSCFYGDALIAHLSGQDVAVLYKATLDLIFKEFT